MAFAPCSKEELPEGPWIEDIKAYPDPKYEFESHGLKCYLKRTSGWNWNGYVTLPLTHPYAKKHYFEIENKIDVHGNLTYGENGTFGFDTAHLSSGDIVPGMLSSKYKTLFDIHDELDFLFPSLFLTSSGGHFWTFEQVKEEVENMAAQFAELQ